MKKIWDIEVKDWNHTINVEASNIERALKAGKLAWERIAKKECFTKRDIQRMPIEKVSLNCTLD